MLLREKRDVQKSLVSFEAINFFHLKGKHGERKLGVLSKE